VTRSPAGQGTGRRHWYRAALAVLAIGAAAAIAIAGSLDSVGAWVNGFRGWIEHLGAWGPTTFVLIYIAATLVMAPCAPLSLIAGLAWGIWAFPLVIASALAGSSLAFQIGRRLARARLRRWTRTHPRSAAVIEAVSDQGWKIVLLLRLSPVVPFNMQNYLFGITNIRFLPYLAATAVGLLPGSALFISIGAFGHGSEDGSSRTLNWILFAIGLAATIAAAVLVTRQVMRKLRRTDPGPPVGETSSAG
jgi:uncharacterized membrane protein YdjX (TVP38/TMEM64 family)